MNRHLWYVPLRHPRSIDEAFRTADYACALTRPYPSLWGRILQALIRWA